MPIQVEKTIAVLFWVVVIVNCCTLCVHCVYSGARQRVGSEMLRLRLRIITCDLSGVRLPACWSWRTGRLHLLHCLYIDRDVITLCLHRPVPRPPPPLPRPTRPPCRPTSFTARGWAWGTMLWLTHDWSGFAKVNVWHWYCGATSKYC